VACIPLIIKYTQVEEFKEKTQHGYYNWTKSMSLFTS